MPAPAFVYMLPWILAAVLFIAAEVRDRLSRKGGPHHEARRKPIRVPWLPAGIFVTGTLIGSTLGALAGPEFHVTWIALYTVSSFVVFIALTRLWGRSLGVTAGVALTVPFALASFLLVCSAA